MGDGNVKLKVVASKLVRELSLSPEESWCWQNNLAQGREEQTNPSFFSTRQLCEFSCPIEPLLYWQNSAVLLYNESAEDSRLMYSSLPKERRSCPYFLPPFALPLVFLEALPELGSVIQYKS